MRRLGLCAVACLAVSCASQPAPGVQEPAAALAKEPTRKERIEEIRVPVPVKETVAFADGIVDRVTAYAYDAGFSRLLSAVSRKPSSSDPSERVVYEYGPAGLASKSTFAADGSLWTRSEYAYGAGGELLRETVLDGKGAVQSVSEWTWEGGKKLTWRVLSAAGTALAKTEYLYSGDAISGSRMLDGSGNLKGRIEYAYEGGAQVLARYFDAKGAPDGRVEYVRKDGRLVQENVYRADGRLERRVSYAYSEDGTLLKKALADGSGRVRETTSYEYAYRAETRTVVYYE